MTKISARSQARIPVEDVPKLAQWYLESLPYSARDGAHTVLRAWVASIAVECEILLRMHPLRGTAKREVLEVHWRPLGDEPYPSFNGTLTAEDLEPGSCTLELAGEYVPPGGILGAAFDAVVGHRIAAESIQDLLGTLATAFEGLRRTVTV